ncbi:ras-related protein Rab-35-like [Sycon ciliatum]|uniref:ras-related protein Rab-35-like n=1 Tax=Sycon ciliatum TaxID=27933 RepID=UPI0020AC048F|eukprot:scpid30904/ scgid29792/ Ras-related protein Rab-33B
MALRPDGGLPRYKIVLVGEEGVGKSSLWYRFKTGRCPGDTLSTVGIDTAHQVRGVKGRPGGGGPHHSDQTALVDEEVELQLWDTGGSEVHYGGMTKNYYRGAHAILFVFAADCSESLQNLNIWLREVASYGDKPQMFFACNKVDLPEEKQTVNSSMIQNFFVTHCADHQQLNHSAMHQRMFYASAKDPCNDGLENAMQCIAEMLHSGGKLAAASNDSLAEMDKSKPQWNCFPCGR